MRMLQRNAIPARAVPAQAGYRPLDDAAQTVATPPGLHYTTGVVQRTSAVDATRPPVVQRVTKRQRPASFDADYAEEDELEATSASANHDYIGLVSWNVQHFSNHDLQGAVELLQQQLSAFDVREWQTLFEEFAGFRDALNEALDVDYKRGTFKRLQGVGGRLGAIAEGLLNYDAFLEEFNVDEFAKKIQILQSKVWHDEIAASDNDQSKRVALLELVGKFKHFIEWIKQARSGLKIMAAVLSDQILIKRMDPELAEEAETLLAKLRKVRDSIVRKSALKGFRTALHSHNIAIHIDEMFAQNDDWLDVVILQEINNPALLDERHADYTIHRGAHLQSTGKHGQNEYYPLLIRKGSGVTVEQEYLVTTDGTLEEVSDDELYKWQKKKSVYRPIMAYLVNKQTESGTQQYLIGVVHTTPEVDGGFAEFNRRAIYDEVTRGLAVLKQWAEDEGLPLIVGGDYYLSAEAVVSDPTPGDLALFDDAYGPGFEEEDEFDEPDQGELDKIRQSINQLIAGLQSIRPTTEQEAVLIRERLKVLAAARGDAQILRNICKLTVQAQVERLGLYLDQTISGTNPKANPLTRWFDLQIADFFIHSDAITESRVGIVRPEGDTVPLDQEDLHYSRYWQNFSDHFPVGGIYGVGEQGIPFDLGRRGQYSQSTAEQARLSNLQRFAYRALVDQGEQARFSGLSEEQIERLALHELRVQIQMIDPFIAIPADVEGCLALIERLEDRYSNIIAEEDRLFVTKPTDFEPDYRAGRSPPVKRQRLTKDDADGGRSSSQPASSAHTDTASHQRGDTTSKSSVGKGKGAARGASQVQPPASVNRIAQDELHAYLDEIAPGWDQPFQNVPGNGAQQGLNQGYLAHQVAHGQRNVALPVHVDAEVEEERIGEHQLRVLRNSGEGAYCFIYSILMGLTGQSERAVFDMVAYIARRAGATRGWINADSQIAANVVQQVQAIYGVQLDVVVVQHGVDGAIVSGRAGQLGGRTVLIRQTPGHYDAYVP